MSEETRPTRAARLDEFEVELERYLENVRAGGQLQEVLDHLDRIADYNVLVIGDAIIDEYQFVQPQGKSLKEHMIASLFQDREIYAGGVFAAANHVASFCRSVDVMTALGDHDSYEDLIRDALHDNVRLHSVTRPDSPTTKKSRFIDSGYMRKLFEVYFMNDAPLPPREQGTLNAWLGEMLDGYDVVIVTDFGHGLIHGSTIELLASRARFLALNTQANSANYGFNTVTKFPRADYVCIDGPEARLATKDKFSDIDEIATSSLPKTIECPNIIVTKGSRGCVTWDGSQMAHVPVLAPTIVDTVGAGDAFFVVTAPLVAAGLTLPLVGFVGNLAGGLKVGIVGHRTSVEKAALVQFAEQLVGDRAR